MPFDCGARYVGADQQLSVCFVYSPGQLNFHVLRVNPIPQDVGCAKRAAAATHGLCVSRYGRKR